MWSRCLGLLALPAALAFPSFRTRVPNGERVPCYPGAVGCAVGDTLKGQPASVCFGLGHATCAGGTLPLNPWGAAWKQAGTWSKALCEEDTDGDGFTNGEELGDPCCNWKYGDQPSAYMQAFTPSHPGVASSKPANYTRPCCTRGHSSLSPTVKSLKTASFNPQEVQKEVTWKIKPYTIPSLQTVYVDVYFNLPEDADEMQLVAGYAVVDASRHLHHYTFDGCAEKFGTADVGKVFASRNGHPQQAAKCNIVMGGFNGWAPGVTEIFHLNNNSGMPFGKKVGVRAIHMNIHYTDGDKAPGTTTQDGLRLLYTTTLRKMVAIHTPILQIGYSRTLAVPPGKERFFVTRSCKLQDSCLDQPDGVVTSETRKRANESVPCQDFPRKKLCPTLGSLCMLTCGRCKKLSKSNPLKVTGVFFHAHLLGREMYMTVQQAGKSCVDNLGSQPIWSFDDQVTFNLETRGIALLPGDTVHSTCVYDSRGRSGATRMGPSTYDEMCFGNLATEMLASEVDYRTRPYAFYCPTTADGNIWTGELRKGQDGKKISMEMPLSKAPVSTQWSSEEYGEAGAPASQGQRRLGEAEPAGGPGGHGAPRSLAGAEAATPRELAVMEICPVTSPVEASAVPGGDSCDSGVKVEMTIRNLDYARVVADGTLERNVRSTIGDNTAKRAGVSSKNVAVTLAPGSVKATTVITLPPTKTADSVKSTIAGNATFTSSMATALSRVSGIKAASTGTILVDGVTVSSHAKHPDNAPGTKVALASLARGAGFSALPAIVGLVLFTCLLA